MQMGHQGLEIQGLISHREKESPLRPPIPANPNANEIHVPALSPMAWAEQSDDIPSSLLDQVLHIHEYERQRLGQELHDSAGQLLVALQLSVAHLRAVEPDFAHGNLLEDISDTVTQIDREIRSLAFLHYPMQLGERGLCRAMQSLARGFESRTGIKTQFQCICDAHGLGETSELALLRVAQEALVNVHRHAHATSVEVTVRRRNGFVSLTVADDGVGVSDEMLEKAFGIGLQGMRHRIQTLGGRFKLTNLSRGTKISAIVPFVA